MEMVKGDVWLTAAAVSDIRKRFKTGAGVGVRWQSPVGPIAGYRQTYRRQRRTTRFTVYIGLGPNYELRFMEDKPRRQLF